METQHSQVRNKIIDIYSNIGFRAPGRSNRQNGGNK